MLCIFHTAFSVIRHHVKLIFQIIPYMTTPSTLPVDQKASPHKKRLPRKTSLEEKHRDSAIGYLHHVAHFFFCLRVPAQCLETAVPVTWGGGNATSS
jgi:hypothetical protein